MPAGRPKKASAKDQLKEIESLIGYGLTVPQVAAYIGMSPRTLQRQAASNGAIAKAIALGKAKALAQIGQSLFKAAAGGNVAAMIFFLKTQGGWREKSELEVGFKPIRVFETTVQPDGSLLQQIIEEDRAKFARLLPQDDASEPDVE